VGAEAVCSSIYEPGTAFNLDGGGSTQMAWLNPVAGQAQVLNAPLQERYVGQSLGVGYW